MTEQEKAQLMAELDAELEKPETELDTEKVDKLIEALSANIEVPVDAGKHLYNKIVKENSEPSKISAKKFKTHTILVAAIILLISAGVITVSAKPSFLLNSIRWIEDKLNLCIVPSEDEQSPDTLRQQLNELICSNEYALPKALSDMSITRFEQNDRVDESSDICLEFMRNDGYWNLIISTYSDSDIVQFEAPANNIEPLDQFAVGEITVTVFKVDDVFTAYYSYNNHSYQITSNIDENDFYGILQQIEI